MTVNGVTSTRSADGVSGIVLTGRGGDDRLEVGGSVDLPAMLDGGPGNDRLLGGGGRDQINGGAGDDVLDGGGGADVLVGGEGDDTVDYASRTVGLSVTLGATADDGEPGEGDDVRGDVENIIGGAGNDTLQGSDSGNRLAGGAGRDSLYGAGGDDVLDGGAGADVLFGGAGRDTADYSARTARVWVGIGTLADDGEAGEGDNVRRDVERVVGGAGDDTLRGTAGSDILEGGGGNDRLYGFGGADTLGGGPGNDRLDGGAGNDLIDGGEGVDTVDYASRTEPVTFAFVERVEYPDLFVRRGSGGAPGESDDAVEVENVTGGSEDDTLSGSSVANVLSGGPGNDVLRGGEGEDRLLGGAGDDRLDGEDGDDVFDGGAGANTIADPRGSARLFDRLLRVVGTSGDDVIAVTQSGASLILTWTGYPASTYPAQSVASVWLDGIGGNDTIRLGNADGSSVPSVPARLAGSVGADTLFGGPGDDTLSGGDHDDTLRGRGGADAMRGGDGQDTVDYSDRTTPLDIFLHGRLKPNDAYGTGPEYVGHGGEAGEGDVLGFDVEVAVGGSGDDRLEGGDGTTLYGGSGDDVLRMTYFDDDVELGDIMLYGGPGNDSLAAEESAGGMLYGEEGDDLLRAQEYSSTGFSGGPGIDTINAEGMHDHGIEIFMGPSEVEIVHGSSSSHGDYIVGSDGADYIDGGAGPDVIYGGGGDDTLTGEYDDDTVFGGTGDDRISGGEGNDVLYGEQDDDLIVGEYGDDALYGGSGDDTLEDTEGTNLFNGGPGVDTINGVREPAGAAVYEAESAAVEGAAVASNHTGYTGDGFVDYVHSAGDFVEWSVDLVSAGTYGLDVRYANGSPSDRPLGLAVNGTLVLSAVPFAPTGSWDAWHTSSATVTLPAGVSTVRLTAAGRGGPNLDSLAVRVIDPPPAVTYEAEAAALSGPVVSSSPGGYTGTGFADYRHASGDFVEFTIDAYAGDDTYGLDFRYANGGANERPLLLAVDDQFVAWLPFGPTGSWRSWRTAAQSVLLTAGRHTVRLTASGSSGSNLDSLTIRPLALQ